MFYFYLFLVQIVFASTLGRAVPVQKPDSNLILDSVLNRVAQLEAVWNSTMREQQTIKDELHSTMSELQTTKDELQSTKTELQLTRTELESTNVNLALKTKDVAFEVYLTSSRDINLTDAKLPVKFAGVHYNTGNGYNATTGIFTAPVSGTYIFSAVLGLWASDETAYVYIVKSSTTVSEEYGKNRWKH